MRLFIDGEWNGYQGDLISLALVAEDGSEWYEVLGCKWPENWVAEHVMPKLGKQAISYKEMQESLTLFLNKFDCVHIVADWPEDIEWFCHVLITGPGERLDIPPLTMEVVRVDTVSKNPHNALADAQALRDFYTQTSAQPTQKPVAWLSSLNDTHPHAVTDLKYCSVAQLRGGDSSKYVPVYASPQLAQPSVSIDTLVAEFEATPEGAEAMEQGRRWVSSVTQPAEVCFCDVNNIREPGVTCDDCPVRDYKQPVPTPASRRMGEPGYVERPLLEFEGPDGVHTCNYFCARPACIKGQRDRLRDSLITKGTP